MKMKKIFSNKYFRYGSLVIGGIFLGWLFFHSPRKTIVQNENTAENKAGNDLDLRHASTDTDARTGQMSDLRDGFDSAESE